MFVPLVLSVLLVVVCGQQMRYDNSKVYTVIPSTPEQQTFLEDMHQNSDLDFWRGPDRVGGGADIMVPPDKQGAFENEITNAGLTFTVSIENVQEIIDKEDAERDKRQSKRS